MLRLITYRNIDEFPALVASMHRDRKSLFVGAFGWDLRHQNGEERDEFDDGAAEYIVLSDGADRHIASLRLLRTDRPHLLDSVFSALCEADIPRGEKIREITRFCVPLHRPARIETRNILARAVNDYAAANGIASYTAVCHARFLSDLLSSGWRCTLLGPPHPCGDSLASAVQIHMSDEITGGLAADWRCPQTAPRLSIPRAELAA
ncbi:MAG: acyl-homoserine-lactone synthase [Parvularculaceae bacterium]